MFKSQAQARFFFAAKEKKNGLNGLKPAIAQKFISDTDHQKLGNLPEYAPEKPKALKFPKLSQGFKTKR